MKKNKIKLEIFEGNPFKKMHAAVVQAIFYALRKKW